MQSPAGTTRTGRSTRGREREREYMDNQPRRPKAAPREQRLTTERPPLDELRSVPPSSRDRSMPEQRARDRRDRDAQAEQYWPPEEPWESQEPWPDDWDGRSADGAGRGARKHQNASGGSRRARAGWSGDENTTPPSARTSRPTAGWRGDVTTGHRRGRDQSWDYDDRVQRAPAPGGPLWDDEVGLSEPVPAARGRGRGRGGQSGWTGQLTGAYQAAAKKGLLRKPVVVAVLVVLLLCAVFPAAGALAAYPVLSRDKTLAQQGLQHIKNAETGFKALASNPFDTQAVAQARGELVAANAEFSQLKHDLGFIPGFFGATPVYGSLLSAGQHLAPVAVELTQAGIVGCDALTLLGTRLKNPLDSSSNGLTAGDMTMLTQYFDQITGLVDTAVEQIKQLQPSDLQADPRLGPAVAVFKSNLPQIQQTMHDLQSFMGVAPLLLGVGKPTQYLVEQLDSTELRPGGGFIGTYGFLTVSSGHMAGIQMQDVDLLDKHSNASPPPIPSQYSWFTLVSQWGFRDSNLDANFPISAQNGEQLFHLEAASEHEDQPVQGVIAVTPWLILNALKITGPIQVPEYNETITADNLIQRIHYHQLLATEGLDNVPDPTGHSSLRKRFTSFLFEHFMAKVKSMAGTPQMAPLMKLLIDSLRTKDIQLYLNPAPAEALLQDFSMASTVQAPAGDSLFVVNANTGADKANYYMTYALHDQVTLDDNGTATHHTTLTYTWPQSQEAVATNYAYSACGCSYYKGYVLVYVPPNSLLKSQAGWSPDTTRQAFGREVYAGTLTVPYGQSVTISLTWAVPHAATKDASGWHYRYLLQKQSGITWPADVQVALPACAALIGSPGELTFFGSHGSLLNPDLTRDTSMSADYSC